MSSRESMKVSIYFVCYKQIWHDCILSIETTNNTSLLYNYNSIVTNNIAYSKCQYKDINIQ